MWVLWKTGGSIANVRFLYRGLRVWPFLYCLLKTNTIACALCWEYCFHADGLNKRRITLPASAWLNLTKKQFTLYIDFFTRKSFILPLTLCDIMHYLCVLDTVLVNWSQVIDNIAVVVPLARNIKITSAEGMVNKVYYQCLKMIFST